MAVTLELYDGSTTLNLLTDPFDAQRGDIALASSIPIPKVAGAVLRDVDFQPRSIRIGLRIVGSTIQDLELQIRKLNDMLSFAEKRQVLDEGTTKVVLKYQLGNTDSQDAETRVLSGSWQSNKNVFHKTLTVGAFSIQGTLNLLVEPFGRLSNVIYTERILNPENDGNLVNYIDLAGPFNSYLTNDGVNDVTVISDHSTIQNTFDGGGEKSVRIYVASDGEGDIGNIWNKNDDQLRTTEEDSGAIKLWFAKNFDSTNGIWETTARDVKLNEWYRVYVSYNADNVGNNPTIGIYREATRTWVTRTVGSGLTKLQAPIGTRTTDVGSDLYLGASSAAGANDYDGRYDDYREYDTVGNVASEDVEGELVGDESNLVCYLPMDEGTGSAAFDKSSNSNDGVITGATWGIDSHIDGDAMAPLRVKVSENGAYGSAGNIWLWARSGERRTDALSFNVPDAVTAETDPAAGTDDGFNFVGSTTGGFNTNTSGGSSARIRWSNDSGLTEATASSLIRVGYFQYNISGANIPRGLFRVLVRVSVESDAASFTDPGSSSFAVGYVFGGVTKTPADAAAVLMSSSDSEDEWHILDLGELSLPPIGLPESDIAPPTLNLRIHAYADGTVEAHSLTVGEHIDWELDAVYLVAVDESAVFIPSVPVSGDNVVFASAISDTPGVWMLTTGGLVSSVPAFNGGPLQIGPEATRLYYLKDDTGDPSSVSSKLLIEYEPQIRTL